MLSLFSVFIEYVIRAFRMFFSASIRPISVFIIPRHRHNWKQAPRSGIIYDYESTPLSDTINTSAAAGIRQNAAERQGQNT